MLVAIEGVDGSGKGTQAQLLCNALADDGKKACLWSFPRYKETRCGEMVGRFLNGEFGTLEQASPYLVGLLFAADRFESQASLLDAIRTYDVVVCDRYVSSNIAHQAAKLPVEQRPDLIKWLNFIEYELYLLPKANITVLLDMPVQYATELIKEKAARAYTDKKADLHEADTGYLQNVYDIYKQLADQRTWTTINCVDVSQPGPRSREIIHGMIVDRLRHI